MQTEPVITVEVDTNVPGSKFGSIHVAIGGGKKSSVVHLLFQLSIEEIICLEPSLLFLFNFNRSGPVPCP